MWSPAPHDGKDRQFFLTEQFLHSFVTSRLDNCNSLLFGLPDNLTHRLQLIRHRSAPLITHGKKHDHITPVMRDLFTGYRLDHRSMSYFI